MGYPQSPPELRQELIAEQFVRRQSDPELKKYLWVVIRTQKDKKLQTLIEVCTDFSSLSTPTHLHRLAEQTFAYISRWRHLYRMRRSVMIQKMCLPWVTIPHGQIGELCYTHPTTDVRAGPPGWDTGCARSPDNQMPKGNRREIDHSLIRTGESTSCTETCASSADRDHTETQEVPSHDVMDGTSVSYTTLQSISLDQTQPRPVTQSGGRSVDWSRTVND